MTLWHKPAYQPSDRDPTTGDLMPGALPPGLYCEDEAAFSKLRAAARLRQSSVRATLDGGWDLAGQRVFVCTPAQAAFFRATASKAPPPPVAPEQSYEEAAAELVRNRETEARGLALEMGRALQAAPPPPTRHPFIGANRQQRRAAEARARRRA